MNQKYQLHKIKIYFYMRANSRGFDNAKGRSTMSANVYKL